jgi:hypothetical protein
MREVSKSNSMRVAIEQREWSRLVLLLQRSVYIHAKETSLPCVRKTGLWKLFSKSDCYKSVGRR